MDQPPAGDEPVDRGASRARDARLVAAARDGDPSAFGQLYDAWFDRVWNVALRIVHDREVAAEVAQDAFLAAWRNLGTLEDDDAFGGWLLRIARNASFNRSRKEGRSRPVDDRGLTVIEATGASPASAPTGFDVQDRARSVDDPSRVAEDTELVALARTSASALGERDAEVLDLQLRYGLSPAEIGEVMGMNRNAANQLCHRVRQRFATAVRARVLWRGDQPACDVLAQMLASAGVSTFDADAVKIADRHAESCPRCGERRELRLEPSAMFAAVPLVAAPIVFKTQTAHALEASGVAMDGSAFGSAGHVGGTPDDDGGDGRGRRRHVRRTLAMAAAAAVVLVAALALFANRTHDGTVDIVALERSTTLPSTTTVPPTVAVEAPTTEVTTDVSIEEPISPEPTVPPSDSAAPDTTPAPDLALVLRPTTTTATDRAPFAMLSWSVAGAASARVEGPAGGENRVLGSTLEGSIEVCPGNHLVSAELCVSPPGTYRYVLRAFDAAGVEVATTSVELVVGS